MALEVGPVVGGIGIEPIQRVTPRDDKAANDTALPLPGQQAAPQAPPLTGIGGKPLSGEALQTLQGTDGSEEEGGQKLLIRCPGSELLEHQIVALLDWCFFDLTDKRFEVGAESHDRIGGPHGRRR